MLNPFSFAQAFSCLEERMACQMLRAKPPHKMRIPSTIITIALALTLIILLFQDGPVHPLEQRENNSEYNNTDHN